MEFDLVCDLTRFQNTYHQRILSLLTSIREIDESSSDTDSSLASQSCNQLNRHVYWKGIINFMYLSHQSLISTNLITLIIKINICEWLVKMKKSKRSHKIRPLWSASPIWTFNYYLFSFIIHFIFTGSIHIFFFKQTNSTS